MNNINSLILSLRYSNHESNDIYHYYIIHLNDIDVDEIAKIKMNILRKRAFELGFNSLIRDVRIRDENV